MCAAGHAVHIPDLYDGNTFASLKEAVGYAKEVGFGTLWSVVNKQLKTCRQSSLVDYDDRLRKLKERVLAFLKSVD